MLATVFLSPSLPKAPLFPSSHSSPTISSSSLNPKPHQNPTPIHVSTILNPDFSLSPDPSSSSNASIIMPTPPWMKGPLLLPPREVIDFSYPGNKNNSHDNRAEKSSDRGLTDKLIGIRGKQAMRKIVKSIEKLERVDNSEETQMGKTENSDETRMDLGRIEFGGCLDGVEEDGDSRIRERMPWERDETFVFRRMKKDKAVSVAELSLDRELLERLRGEAKKMRQWVKVKKAGVTQAVVNEIQFIWKEKELATVKFDVPLCRNMDRAQEIVELKTGGLVVWSKKDSLVVYRGCNYISSLKDFSKNHPGYFRKQENNNSQVKSNERSSYESMNVKYVEGDFRPSGVLLKENVNLETVKGSLYERETDRLLDGLGPRFVDWWMHKPLPVDADLLPEVVPGFKPPFRHCPPDTKKPKLTDNELTYLRKLAQPLPTHFVLGRNRKLQGLAAAILKLWEKSLIVKIAVKLGIPNTNNKQMAHELETLTGGVVLLRNKFMIILYRGKDFLPCRVANLIAGRERELKRCQFYEESARLRASEAVCPDDRLLEETSIAGTFSDFQVIHKEFGDLGKENTETELRLKAEKEKLERELKIQERRLSILNLKMKKSAKDLSRLNASWIPAEQDGDRESITDEERECFRRIGKKMDSCLVLGRRGVFDGVIEGLHQHWKHREVVKAITMQRVFRQVIYTAKLLEAESGGILVSVEKLKEGHAIIIYRGKNYRRPLKGAAKNLLTKREALRKSLEMQRVGSLRFFTNQRQQTISELKHELDNLIEKQGNGILGFDKI